MKKTIFLILFAFALTFSFANETEDEVTCNPPANVTTVAQSAGSVSFDWDDCTGGCTEYKVWYVRQDDGYTSNKVTTSASDISFSGLADGTYDFYFATVCAGGVSSIIGVEELIL